MLTVNAIECLNCGDKIFSRTGQDFRQCDCKNVSVEGGLKHFKYNISPLADFAIKKIKVDLTINELYDDWNSMNDRYGLIKREDDYISAAM